jgi:hypothetical protein
MIQNNCVINMFSCGLDSSQGLAIIRIKSIHKKEKGIPKNSKVL